MPSARDVLVAASHKNYVMHVSRVMRLNHVITNEPMMACADSAGRSNASRRTDFFQLRPRVDAARISASRP